MLGVEPFKFEVLIYSSIFFNYLFDLRKKQSVTLIMIIIIKLFTAVEIPASFDGQPHLRTPFNVLLP